MLTLLPKNEVEQARQVWRVYLNIQIWTKKFSSNPWGLADIFFNDWLGNSTIGSIFSQELRIYFFSFHSCKNMATRVSMSFHLVFVISIPKYISKKNLSIILVMGYRRKRFNKDFWICKPFWIKYWAISSLVIWLSLCHKNELYPWNFNRRFW